MAGTPPSLSPPDSSFQSVLTLSEALRYRAQHNPDKAAFIFRAPDTDKRHVLTFRDLYQLGGGWASMLHQRGVGRGQYVVSTLPNSPERAVVDSAILLSGAACVNGVCQLSDASDLKAILRQSAAVAVVLDPVMPDVYTALLRDVTEPKEDGSVTSESLPSLKFVFVVRRRDDSPQYFLSYLRERVSGDSFYEKDVREGDVCIVFATSGSTGSCKLVPFSHGLFVQFGKAANIPLASSAEFNIGLMGWGCSYFGQVVVSGATRVLLDARAGLPQDFASFIIRSVKEEGVTVGTVPICLIPVLGKKLDVLNNGQPLFERLILTAQPITKKIVQEASRVAPVLAVVYGSTEMLSATGDFSLDANTFEDYFVGRVLQGVEVKVCDDHGRAVKANMRGEVLLKSPFMFHGYLNDPQSTAAAFTQDGYFRSGDAGWLDSEDYLYVEGRGKDAIMYGGDVVYPGWLESRVRSCSAVLDVMVVGVPDVMLISELCACVVLQSEEWSIDDVKKYVEKDIVDDLTDGLTVRPRHYLKFDSFPLTGTGKPRRMEVQKVAGQRLVENK